MVAKLFRTLRVDTIVEPMTKYGRVAEQNNLRFVPVVFSHTGQIHGEFKAFVREQIRHKFS